MPPQPHIRDDAPLPRRVLLTYRQDIDTQGGAAFVMRRTAQALRELGLDVEESFERYPDLAGFDLVQAFNVWRPDSALEQLRYLRESGLPVVWQPLFLHWRETAWASVAVRAVLGQEDAAARAHLLAEMASGRVVVNGLSQHGANEIVPGFDRLVAAMADCVDHICVVAHREMQALSQVARLAAKPYTIVPHGVDAEFFASASPKPFRDFSGLRDFVLCVGAVDPRKNQGMLAEALRESGRTLVLIGPCYEPDYLRLVLARGGERLLHFERLPHDLVASALKAASVHVLPSFAEASALASLEAAASGCPIVVSNRSSEFEYYGDLATYCDPSDPDTIAAAVELALETHALNPERSAALARHVRGYTWQRSAEATLEAYGRTLGSSGRALIPDARGFLTVSFAEELLAAPEQLSAYASAFSADDDATLLILVPADDATTLQRLQRTVAAAGLGDDGTVDMIASTIPARAWASLAARANAVYSEAPSPPALDRLPRFGPADASALRREAVRAGRALARA